jgi:hypothetical protein
MVTYLGGKMLSIVIVLITISLNTRGMLLNYMKKLIETTRV